MSERNNHCQSLFLFVEAVSQQKVDNCVFCRRVLVLPCKPEFYLLIDKSNGCAVNNDFRGALHYG